MAKLAMLFIAFVYLDFSIWYSAGMHNIYNEKKRKYRGILFHFWDIAHDIKAADVVPVPDGGIGELSDGYHTFNGLYYQRMVLFSALVNAHNDKAWKSWKHEDGKPCFDGGWFIVGIDTLIPQNFCPNCGAKMDGEA